MGVLTLTVDSIYLSEIVLVTLIKKQEDFYLNPFYEKDVNYSIKKLTVDSHQHHFTIWYDIHNVALGQSLKSSEYDSRIWDKKIQNENIISKIKSYHEYLDKLGSINDNNFIKFNSN